MDLCSDYQRVLVYRDEQSSVVLDKGDYIVVRTPERPGYYWGNYIIMAGAPAAGDYGEWVGIFESEIGPKEETGFVAITWDTGSNEDGYGQFVDEGFDLQRSVILSASSVSVPPKSNGDIVIRALESEADFAQSIDVHFSPGWQYSSDEEQMKFFGDSVKELQGLVDAGCAVALGGISG